MTLTTQILFNKRSAFLERHVGFWRTDDVQLKNVDHTFIQIQLDRLTSGIQRLILTNKIAKKDLLDASLNQGGRKSLAIVAIHRGHIGILLIFWIGIGIGRVFEVLVIDVQGFGLFQRDIGIACIGNVRLG